MRRKHSKIDKLPDNLRMAVEQMMQADYTYSEIADYIRDNGFEISIASVFRHARTLNKTVQDLRMIQENQRVIMEEIAKYPQFDPSEAIIRLVSHQMLEAIRTMTPAKLAELEPDKLIRQANALIRASAYKSRVELMNKDDMDVGLEKVKVLVFEAMSKEEPELYAQVSKFLAGKGGGT
jgi:hypothetical protein